MIRANPRLVTLGIIFSLLVAAGAIYGLFGERLGISEIYHPSAGPSAPTAK